MKETVGIGILIFRTGDGKIMQQIRITRIKKRTNSDISEEKTQPAITCSKLTNNKNNRTKCEICSKLAIKIPERRH